MAIKSVYNPTRSKYASSGVHNYHISNPGSESVKCSQNTSISKDTSSGYKSLNSKHRPNSKSNKCTFNYQGEKKASKCRKKSPNQSLNVHHRKMTTNKNSMTKKKKIVKNTKDVSQVVSKQVLDMGSEREAVVYKKRGQKKNHILTDKSSLMSEARQSLIEAKEPTPEVISRASYLRTQELTNDNIDSTNRDRQVPAIMNIYTVDSKNYFGKAKYSNTRSTFLNEEEEEDMLNVNEFTNNEEVPSNKCVKVGMLTHNRRILKALPITKESFLNWQRHSVLKSFATSQEASFISNRPTDRMESNRTHNENLFPDELKKRDQEYYKKKIPHSNIKRQRNQSRTNYVHEESPAQASSVFMDESSGFFEEFAHTSDD